MACDQRDGRHASTSVEGRDAVHRTCCDGMKAALAPAFGTVHQRLRRQHLKQPCRCDPVLHRHRQHGVRSGQVSPRIRRRRASWTGRVRCLGVRDWCFVPGYGCESSCQWVKRSPFSVTCLGLATGGAADKMRDMADKTRTGGEGISTCWKALLTYPRHSDPALGQAQDRFNEFGWGHEVSAAFTMSRRR